MSTPVLGHDGSLPQGETKRAAVEGMFDRLAPRYDRMNRIISLGLDRRWRKRTVAALALPAGSRVVDLACGTGDLCRDLAAAGCEPIGVDFSAGMLSVARTDAPLVRADGACLPVGNAAVDGITCGFALRNFVDLDTVFGECARVLRTGGRFAALDATRPTNPVMRAGNAVWFRGAVPLLGRALTHDAEAYRYLPKSTAYLPPAPVLAERLSRGRVLRRLAPVPHRGFGRPPHGDPHMTTTPAPTRLHAVTREIEPGRDLLHEFDPTGFAWLHHQTRLITSGVAARVDADDIDATLATVAAVDPLELPGTGAVAVGALPFDPDARGELVIPARIIGELDGRAWITEIGPAPPNPDPAPGVPTRFAVVATRSRDQWRVAVEQALAAIARGDLEKVVLAREVLIEADTPFDTRDILRGLVAHQPGSFVYASDGFVGASPELLVRRAGAVVESRPVAGTTVADSDEALLALAASVKDTREHRYVVDGIVDALGDLCSDLSVESIPEVAVFGPVAHLATPICGQLRQPGPSALDLARLLHPTPAVGGTPRVAALNAIRALEGFDRGRYAGPVGWVDARGDGEWAIVLRGAELDGTRARLVAGAGIVAGSDPDAEWAETQAKLEPMLRALVRP